MKYLLRSLKQFLFFCCIVALCIGVLVLTGMVNNDINEIFKDGYSSLLQMAGLLAAFSAIYPKIGYYDRQMYINSNLDSISEEVIRYMEDRRYVLEHRDSTGMTFRARGFGNRLLKMFEDRITFTQTPHGLVYMEGKRKDVMRLSSGLEYRLENPDRE